MLPVGICLKTINDPMGISSEGLKLLPSELCVKLMRLALPLSTQPFAAVL